MKKNAAKVFAIFTNNWLGVSETFIFRQTFPLSKHGEVFVLTQNKKDSKILNNDFFKPDVFLSRRSKLDLYRGIIKRKLLLGSNLYSATKSQSRPWRKVLEEKKPTLLHAHYGTAGLAILDVTKKLSIPQITTFHGNDASVLVKKAAYVRSLKELFNYSYIITVSNFIRDRLISLGANPERIFCHYIGTDLSSFEYVDRDKTIGDKIQHSETIKFLQISNFVEKKGHLYSIQAFAKYLTHNENAELILAGDGVLRPQVENLVKELGISHKVKFLGAIGPKEVYSLMKSCDIFLHHSITGENGSEEGIPTVIMEAMAVGITVVSTYHAGIPELVVPFECGILVKEKNVDEYAQALIDLKNLNTINMSRTAFERVSEFFDVEKQNELLLKTYNKVLLDYEKREL